MNSKVLFVAFVVLSLLAIGCAQETKYQDYNQPAQNPAVGGGCGVEGQDAEPILPQYNKVLENL